jgi:addiction module RelE/StbE family toxin
MFKDRYHPAVRKDLKRVDLATRQNISDELIPRLLADPYCGEELKGLLAGIRSFHFRIRAVEYRIAYCIKETEQVIEILMIGKRDSFYRVLSRRLK